MTVIYPWSHSFSAFIDVFAKSDTEGSDDKKMEMVVEIDVESCICRANVCDENGRIKVIGDCVAAVMTFECSKIRLHRNAPSDVRDDYLKFAREHQDSPIRFQA